MKKSSVLIILILLAVCLAGCSHDGSSANDGSSAGSSSGINTENPVSEEETDTSHFRTVGSTVIFGNYEQDNNLKNGLEPIEWIVLDVQDGKALLLSKRGLDTLTYHHGPYITTWEQCALRTWLNNDFFEAAFSETEQSAILMSDINNDMSQGYSEYKTSGGNNTQDRLFLLSYHEAYEQYFSSDDARKCAPTEYALRKGALINNTCYQDGRWAGMWWLRSPGEWENSAMFVNSTGLPYDSRVHHTGRIVRPAFWLNLESGII